MICVRFWKMQIISIPATIVTAVGDYNVQELEAEGVVYNFHSSPCLKGSSDFTSLMEIITSTIYFVWKH